MLDEAENIAGWIAKPSYFRTAGRGPDAQFVLRGERIDDNFNVDAVEVGDRGGDLGNFPAEDGERRGLEFLDFHDAQRVSIRLEDESEFFFAHKRQAELVAIKMFGGGRIGGGDESDHFQETSAVGVGMANRISGSRFA